MSIGYSLIGINIYVNNLSIFQQTVAHYSIDILLRFASGTAIFLLTINIFITFRDIEQSWQNSAGFFLRDSRVEGKFESRSVHESVMNVNQRFLDSSRRV